MLRYTVFPDIEDEHEVNDNTNNNSGFWQLDVDTAADPLKNTGKLISSYVLKTLVLFEWQENPGNELWSENNLSQRLVSGFLPFGQKFRFSWFTFPDSKSPVVIRTGALRKVFGPVKP